MLVSCPCGSSTLLATYRLGDAPHRMHDPVLAWTERDGTVVPLVLASKTPATVPVYESYTCIRCNTTGSISRLRIVDHD